MTISKAEIEYENKPWKSEDNRLELAQFNLDPAPRHDAPAKIRNLSDD